MGHNSVVSGHPKSMGILLVVGLSRGPLDLGCHRFGFTLLVKKSVPHS